MHLGLHRADVERLLRVLHRLVNSSHNAVVIEHDLDLIAEANWTRGSPGPLPMRLYLAGFDVFHADAPAQGARLKALCAEFSHDGLFPLDNQLPAGLQGAAAARWICDANLALLRAADAVLANLNSFRGHEPDSGTAFELGFAVALGKPVWAYLADGRTLVQQLGGPTDADGFAVEDFGLSRNLMLACTATLVVGDARAALAALSCAGEGG